MKHLAWKVRIVLDMTVKATEEDYHQALKDAESAVMAVVKYPEGYDSVPNDCQVTRAGYNISKNLLMTHKGDIENATLALFYASLRKSLRDSAIKEYVRADECSGVSATCEVVPKSNKVTKKETQ